LKLYLFDIQRFCVHDGPGIRTSVFLKGCPLQCLWCHNPESAIKEEQLLYYAEKCNGCGRCVEFCNTGANSIIEGLHVFKRDNCSMCGHCAKICPQDAFEIAGYVIEPDELIKKIIRDRAFYEETGGGVTFTGGEPLAQLSVLKEIINKCRDERINIAIETSMMALWSDIVNLIETVDLWICDLKAITGELHKKGTGVNNDIILRNLCKMKSAAHKMWIRIPLVMGFNDSDEEFEKIAEFLREYELARVEIMPYHDLGLSKYYALNQEKKEFEFTVPSEKYISRFKDILISNNVRNVI
jgi:pyruvate formate lyase activating enzyme